MPSYEPSLDITWKANLALNMSSWRFCHRSKNLTLWCKTGFCKEGGDLATRQMSPAHKKLVPRNRSVQSECVGRSSVDESASRIVSESARKSSIQSSSTSACKSFILFTESVPLGKSYLPQVQYVQYRQHRLKTLQQVVRDKRNLSFNKCKRNKCATLTCYRIKSVALMLQLIEKEGLHNSRTKT